MSRIMLDLETMGTAADSAIVAIGAVKFNDRVILDRFDVTVDLQSCIAAGLKVDGGAIRFWLKQEEAARGYIAGGAQLELGAALLHFRDWAGEITEVWGNGANFDEPILENAYSALDLVTPWRFCQSRCHRTMKEQFPHVPPPKFIGIEHNALHDAENQALHLIKILQHLEKSNA